MATTEAAEQKAPARRAPKGLGAASDFTRAIVFGFAYVVISYLAAGLGGTVVAGDDASWPAFWFLQILIYAALSVIIVLFSQMIDDRATDTGLGGPAVFLMALGTLVSFAAFVINEFKQVPESKDHNIVRENYAAFFGAPDKQQVAYLIFCTVMLVIYAIAAGVVVWSLLNSREQGLLRKVMGFFRKINTADQQKQVGRDIDVRVAELMRLSALRDRIVALQAPRVAAAARHAWFSRQTDEFHALRLPAAFRSDKVAADAPDAAALALVEPLYAATLASIDSASERLGSEAATWAGRVTALDTERADLLQQAGFADLAPLEARIAELETETAGLRSQLSGARSADGLLSLTDMPESDHIHGVARILGIGMFVTVLLMTLNNYLLAPELNDKIGLGVGPVLLLLGLFLVQAVVAYFGLTSARMFLVKRQIARRARQSPPGPPLAQRLAALVLLGLLGLLIYMLMRLSEPSVARPLATVDLVCRAYDSGKGHQTPQGLWVYNSAAELEADTCRLAQPLDHQSYVVVVGAASQEGDSVEQAELARARAHTLAARMRAETDAEKVAVFVLNLGQAKKAELPEGLTPEALKQATRAQRPLLVLAGNLEPEKPGLGARVKAIFVRHKAAPPDADTVRAKVIDAVGAIEGVALTDYSLTKCSLYPYTDGGSAPTCPSEPAQGPEGDAPQDQK